jgi:5-methylcytosine-specific restriction endonuclease McrA
VPCWGAVRTRLTTTQQGLGYRWQRLRPLILARDGYRCHWCGARAGEVDHVVARALGGARYDPANLVASCQPCNRRRGGELAERLAGGRRPPRAARRVWPGAIDIA